MYETATEYRRAVDEALFGLGRERYEALVGLLIQLRQPQLSKKPDEKLLSRALTEALPPLDPALIGEVAEAFRPLQGPILVALLYFLGAEAAFYIGTLSDQIFALFWPPNVICFVPCSLCPSGGGGPMWRRPSQRTSPPSSPSECRRPNCSWPSRPIVWR